MTSFFRNLYYNLRYAGKLKAAKKELAEWSAKLKDGGLPAFQVMMSQFRWRSDGPVEWVPDSPEMVVARGWQDDCDGAAVIAKWGLAQIGIKADIWRLYRSGSGHRVCVARDRSLFTSNGDVAHIPRHADVDWQLYIINWAWHRANRYDGMKRV